MFKGQFLALWLVVTLLLVGCEGGLVAMTPIPTSTPAPTATPLPTPTLTPTVTPLPTPTPSLSPQEIMERVKVLLEEVADAEVEGNIEASQEAAFQALALYLSLPEIAEMTEEEMGEELFSLGEGARIEMWVTGVEVKRVEKQPPLYLVKFGLYPIALFWREAEEPFHYSPVAEGEAIQGAQLVDDELGLIFAYVGASSVTPDYVLLRRDEEGWARVWPEEGEERDLWITVDGEVEFVGEGLSLLRTRGSSFGAYVEGESFFECHACPHRTLSLLWERRGDEYLPQVTLPPDAPYPDRLWEITEPSPYATLYEFLRRLREGDEKGALKLATAPQVVEKAKALGLDDPEVVYLAEWEPGPPQETYLFSTDDLSRRFRATFVPPEEEGEHWLLKGLAEE